jgi:hypothetical protein
MMTRKLQSIALELAQTYPVLTISGFKTGGCVVYGGELQFISKENVIVTGYEKFGTLLENYFNA